MTVVGIDVGGTKKGFHGCAIDSPCEAAPAGMKARPDEKEFNKAGICHIRFTPALELMEDNPYYEWVLHGRRLYAALKKRLEPYGKIIVPAGPLH